MRRRSTFIYHPQLDIDPSQLRVSGDTFVISQLEAAREERLTFGFNELPQEIWQVLRQAHELHIRWSSEVSYSTGPPFASRLSPGLHVFYTPLKQQESDLLCPLLHKVFSNQLKCSSPSATFVSPPVLSDRFASTASLQYHSLLPSLSELVVYIQQKLCSHSDLSCIYSASLLNIVDYLDIDYDSISHALTFTAYWSKPPPVFFDPISSATFYDSWTVTIDASAEKAEVGILSTAPTTDPTELQLSGFLTVVGEDTHPAPTLFSFPSRHHLPTPLQTYSTSFLHPTGLHPVLQLTFKSSSLRPPADICALHAYFTFPSVLFPDPYQLSTTDPLFLASHNLVAARAIYGETDLEAPNYLISKFGAAVLLELAHPMQSSPVTNTDLFNVTIPLHLRYLPPSQISDSTLVRIPWPHVFWACPAESGTKFPVNPFDRVNLGYEGLFGPRTVFYHLEPAGNATQGRLVEEIQVPVLNTGRVSAGTVELATVLAVLAGWAWVVWKMWPGLRREVEELLGWTGKVVKGKEEEKDAKKDQ